MSETLPGDAIDPGVLDEAADWLMRLSASDATPADREACERWRQSSAEHARAWARAQALLRKLGGLPASLAMPVLDRPARGGRRAALGQFGKLAVLLGVAPAGWATWRELERRGWTADHRTAAGERRDVTLLDGSRITLNTLSAIDVRFGTAERLVWLHAGEILVETGHRGEFAQRPFRVATQQGRLEAIGTRFSVREQVGWTQVAVYEGRVRLEPRNGGLARVLEAGEQARFSPDGIDRVMAVDKMAATAWTQGLLLADGMTLADLAAELERYRPGTVSCDPAIAKLRVSGSFPVGGRTGTDRSLAMLAATYPIVLRVRLGGLWVTLSARDAS